MNLIFASVIGLLMISIGVSARLGYNKRLYLSVSVPVLLPEAMRYSILPLGVSFIVLEVIGSNLVPIEYRAILLVVICGPLLILSFFLAIWQPAWLLPDWLNYLHQTYGHKTTKILLNEARKDIPAWLKQVETHEGLVEWAEATAAHLRIRPSVSYRSSEQPPFEE